MATTKKEQVVPNPKKQQIKDETPVPVRAIQKIREPVNR